jgi:hypothetical protein
MPHRWVDSRVERLCGRLSERGLFVDPSDAAGLINDRVDAIAAALHISVTAARRYMDAEALDGLADTMVGLLADEQPGVDLMSQPRDVAIPGPVMGRTTAGLAEAIQIYVEHDSTSETGQDQIRSLAQALSLLGQFMTESAELPTRVPKALVARVASQLERAARVPEASTELAAAFSRDAMRLRSLGD